MDYPPSTSRIMSTLCSQLVMFGAVTLLAVACADKSVDKKNDTTLATQQTDGTPTTTSSTPAPLPVETASTTPHVNTKSGAALTCGPTTFGLGDTLTLRMRTPHGHYLWVTRSDRTAYLIVYPPQGELKAEYSLVPSDEFTRVETIRLPAQIEAVPYVYSRDTVRERVFSEPGKYLLEVGDNFATDLGSSAPSCNLTFVHKESK
jgi:hypothetical protein